jgi:type I restriction enzyme S subunit
MSFPRYPKYKDSGVEWLGEVPEHWTVHRLKRFICSLESGTSVNAADIPATEAEVGVLKTSCVYAGEFDPSENKTIVAEEVGRATCPVRKGTLIVSRMNTPDLVGAAGLVKDQHPNLFLPDRLWQITLCDSEPRFIHYWTQSAEYRHVLQAASSGTSSSMQNLGQDEFRSFLLPTPLRDEQVAISYFLDHETAKIDALIDEQRRLIALLKEMRQAVISHAITKGLDSSVPFKDSRDFEFGHIPYHWELRTIKSIAKVGNGSTPSRENPEYWEEGNFPWLSSTVVNQDEVRDAEEFITAKALRECHLPIVQADSILIGITGQGRTRGMATILRFESTINQHIAYVTLRDSTINIEYLRRLFEVLYEFMRRESDGGGSTKGAITCEWLQKLRLAMPPRQEQDDCC